MILIRPPRCGRRTAAPAPPAPRAAASPDPVACRVRDGGEVEHHRERGHHLRIVSRAFPSPPARRRGRRRRPGVSLSTGRSPSTGSTLPSAVRVLHLRGLADVDVACLPPGRDVPQRRRLLGLRRGGSGRERGATRARPRPSLAAAVPPASWRTLRAYRGAASRPPTLNITR